MNPQEKENRAENREEKNHDEKRKEKTDKPSRLGKEAKIGAAFIVVLLAVFAGVVVMRLTRSDDKEKELALAADRDFGKHRPPPASKDDPLFNGVDSRSFGGRQPTRVPASAASTRSPGGIDSNLPKWQLPDKNESKRVESRYAPVVPPTSSPPFGGNPPKASHGSRYDPVASDPLPGLGADKPSRFDKKPSGLPLDPPDVKKRGVHADSVGSVTTREDFEHGDLSGFASVDDPSASSGYRHDSHRDDQSAALLPPKPVRDNPSYDGGAGRPYAGARASQYDDDFPRASANPDYDRGKPNRYDAPSYGSQPPLRTDGKYEIRPNDSYWTISQTVYGTRAYYKALAERNRSKVGNEDRLKPGEWISTPSIAQLEKSYPELCPKTSRRETRESGMTPVSSRQSYRGGRTYKVSEGDTLFNIARYELGKASRWAEIYDLNRDVLGKDFNYLTPGMKLVLPDNEKADVVAGKSSDLYR